MFVFPNGVTALSEKVERQGRIMKRLGMIATYNLQRRLVVQIKCSSTKHVISEIILREQNFHTH